MRFNLNHKNSLLFGYEGRAEAESPTQQAIFYADICTRFLEEHDMQYYKAVHIYLNSPDGAGEIADWLRGKGWRVEKWCVGESFDEPLAWGLNFDDQCPRFAAAKLRGWRYVE